MSQDIDENDPLKDGIVLLFPEFELFVPNFFPAELERIPQDGYRDYVFWGDSAYANVQLSSDEEYTLGLKVKRDTLNLSEDLDNSIADKYFVLRPHSTVDAFRLSVANEHSTFEVSNTGDDKVVEGRQDWTDISPFILLSDSAMCFSFVAQESTVEPFDISALHNLRDTSVLIPGEYSIIAEYTRDGKLFAHWVDNVILKIERIQPNGVVETKYVVFWINDSC